MLEFASEFWNYFRVRKKFWLLPLVFVLLVVVGLLVVSKGSVVAPFIYTLF